METWEDCLAALRTGTPPEEVLPQIRRLFTELPPPAEPHSPETPLSRLFTRLPYGAGIMQMPYLRPPFSIFSKLQDERQTLFDSEMDFDLLELFQPMFVAPPEEEVREMLKTATLGERYVDEIEVDSVEEGPQESKVGREELRRYTREVEQIFINDGSVPSFPVMDCPEWAVIFSGINNVTCANIKRFLLMVNQATLAYVVLLAVIPRLACEDMDQVIEVVEIAAAGAELHTLPVNKVRSLLQLYRGMGMGAVAALAQLKIVTYMNKR